MLLTVRISNALHRFCQKCCAFHSDLSAFDGSKKSCRRRLAEHNARRQNDNKTSNSARRTASATAAASAASYGGNKDASPLCRKPSTSALLADAATGPVIEATKGRAMTQEDYALFQEFGGRSGRPQRACKAAAVRALAAAAEADCSFSGSESVNASDSNGGLPDTAGSTAASHGEGTFTAMSEPINEARRTEPDRPSLQSAAQQHRPSSAQYMLCDFMIEVPASIDMDPGTVEATVRTINQHNTHVDNGLEQGAPQQDGLQPLPLLWCDSDTVADLLPDDTFEPTSACTMTTPMTISFGDGSSASSAAILHTEGTELGVSLAGTPREAPTTAMLMDTGPQWLPVAGSPLAVTNSDPLLSSYSSRWVGGSAVPVPNLSAGGSSGNVTGHDTASYVPNIEMNQRPAGKSTSPMAFRAPSGAFARRSAHNGSAHSNKSALQAHPVWRSSSPDLLPATAPAAQMSCSPADELQSLLPAGIEWDSHQAMQAEIPSCVTQQQEGSNHPPWFDNTALEQLQPPALNAAEQPPLWQVWQEQQRTRQEAAATKSVAAVFHGQPQEDTSSSFGLLAIPSWSDFAGLESLNASAGSPAAPLDYSLRMAPAPRARTRSPLDHLQQAHSQVPRYTLQPAAHVPPMPLLPPSLQRRLQAHREQQYALSFGSLPQQQVQKEEELQATRAAATTTWFRPGPFFTHTSAS